MNVSYNWLNERLDLSGHSIADLSDLLTFSGIEVEGIESSGVPTDLIVVAHIKEPAPRPQPRNTEFSFQSRSPKVGTSSKARSWSKSLPTSLTGLR